MIGDLELLQDYARNKSEESFAALVNRHLNLVYSAALRQVRSPQLAEEVAQAVFMDLSQSAGKLRPGTIMTAWLYQVTRRTAIDVVRREARRQLREQIATEMNAMNANTADWTHIEPLLDEAMDVLDETDRAAVLLRYFDNKSLREVGATLGTSDDAAQKRVSRAVERLREFFAKRGVAASVGGLGVVLSANAVQAAPVGLTATISAAVLAGTVVPTATLVAATKAIAMTTLQKTLVTATIAAALGAGIYEARQAATLRTQVETLRQQQAPLAGQLAQLRAENESLSNQVAQDRNSQALTQTPSSELLRLRNKATLAQVDSRELARLKSQLAQQAGTVPDAFTNAMATGMASAQKWKEKNALARLARMTTRLNLTEQRAQAISEIMTNRIQRESRMTLDMMMGKLSPEDHQQALFGDRDKTEADIKALFTADQLAAYPEFVQEERSADADRSARTDAGRIAGDFNLSKDQQEKLRAMLYQMNLGESAGSPGQPASSQAGKAGTFADSVTMMISEQQRQLEEKLKILGDFLSLEQLATYRQEQTEEINRQASAIKMFLPKKTAETAQ